MEKQQIKSQVSKITLRDVDWYIEFITKQHHCEECSYIAENPVTVGPNEIRPLEQVFKISHPVAKRIAGLYYAEFPEEGETDLLLDAVAFFLVSLLWHKYFFETKNETKDELLAEAVAHYKTGQYMKLGKHFMTNPWLFLISLFVIVPLFTGMFIWALVDSFGATHSNDFPLWQRLLFVAGPFLLFPSIWRETYQFRKFYNYRKTHKL